MIVLLLGVLRLNKGKKDEDKNTALIVLSE